MATPQSREACAAISESFLEVYPPTRVDTLLGFGSVIDGRSTESDLDVYVLLANWQEDDVERAREAVAMLAPYPVDLTLQYTSELPAKPSSFRLENKSCLALAYLASAELLHGENIPAAMFKELPASALRVSALKAVFYYLALMRREMATYEDEARMTERMDKYFSRSLIDAMLFYEKTTYAPFRTLRPAGVTQMALEHPHLSTVLQGADLESNPGKLHALHKLHAQLRLSNWNIAAASEIFPSDSPDHSHSIRT